jgi:hypothetical protein
MSDILRLKIESALLEGASHLQRLDSGTVKLAGIFPLTPETLASLADDNVSLLDQFIYRFNKLQDAMGTRLFPAFVSMITGSDEPRPFIDTLNQLEKVGVIASIETWQTLRVLRNNLAHDYPDSKEQCVATLNMLFSRWRQLEVMYNCAKTYYQEKLLPLLT